MNRSGVEVPLIHGTVIDDVLRGMSRYGVLIFFVLSGYLITTLLVRERNATNTVSLERFWLCRAFRILPVVMVFLAVTGLLAACHVLDIRPFAFMSAATYTWNYQFAFADWRHAGRDVDVLGHLWTLSVEEQFYVLFPLLVWLFRPRACLWSCLSLIALTPGIRVAQYAFFPSTREFITTMGHTMFGASIAFGCALALAEHLMVGLRARRLMSGDLIFWTAVTYGFVLDPMLRTRFRGAWQLPIGESLAGLSALVILMHVIRFADTRFEGRFLNRPAVVWFGTLSYSTYIWQQLFYRFDVTSVPLIASRVVMTVAAVGAACLSFYTIELPILRLRDSIVRCRVRVRSLKTCFAGDVKVKSLINNV